MAKNDITLFWKAYPGYYKKLHQIVMMTTTIWIVSIHLEEKTNWSYKKKYSNMMIIVTWQCLEKTRRSWNIIKIKKSLKTPFLIYAATESLLEKIDAGDNNQQKGSTANVSKNMVCGYSVFRDCSPNSSKSKYDFAEVLTAWKSSDLRKTCSRNNLL